VQHLSSQECTFLGILLQKVSEDLDSMLWS
jgi:hypothetical protein